MYLHCLGLIQLLSLLSKRMLWMSENDISMLVLLKTKQKYIPYNMLRLEHKPQGHHYMPLSITLLSSICSWWNRNSQHYLNKCPGSTPIHCRSCSSAPSATVEANTIKALRCLNPKMRSRETLSTSEASEDISIMCKIGLCYVSTKFSTGSSSTASTGGVENVPYPS